MVAARSNAPAGKPPVQKRGEAERQRRVSEFLARFPRVTIGSSSPISPQSTAMAGRRGWRMSSGKPGGPERDDRHGEHRTARPRHRGQVDPQW